jgi:hypothetical protein
LYETSSQMREFHLAAQILKSPDQVGDGLRVVQPLKVVGLWSLQATGWQYQGGTGLGPNVTPEYGLITPILGHSVPQSIPGALDHPPGYLRADGQLFSRIAHALRFTTK